MNRPIPIAARTDAEAAYIEAFDSAELKLRGASDLRASAMGRFAASGLPSRRVEAWHYTDLRALLRNAAPVRAPDDFTVAMARECLNRPKAQTNSTRLVVLNGSFRPDLSDLPDRPRPAPFSSTPHVCARSWMPPSSASGCRTIATPSRHRPPRPRSQPEKATRLALGAAG